jgi:hypothetical protein
MSTPTQDKIKKLNAEIEYKKAKIGMLNIEIDLKKSHIKLINEAEAEPKVSTAEDVYNDKYFRIEGCINKAVIISMLKYMHQNGRLERDLEVRPFINAHKKYKEAIIKYQPVSLEMSWAERERKIQDAGRKMDEAFANIPPLTKEHK